MYFESHAHYDDKRFGDRNTLLVALKQAGVETIVNIGISLSSSKQSIQLSKKYDHVYATVGVHPHNAKELTDENFPLLQQLAEEKKVVAIGEIGLDFHYDHSPRDTQRYWFKKQLTLAKQMQLPVVIHSREASQETFDIIKKSGVRDGVIHCYSGSAEMAKEYVKMGFFIGVGGVITYKNARTLIEVVSQTPLEHILIETDSPYLSPEPFRGKRNDSQNLKYIVQKIAQIKQIPTENIEKITQENGRKLFNIN